ncbi:ABC transporter permease [Deinococcus yavapaiensis]|uniref:ABC-2 type transport system permease protein n=1 Tax=Deinococcus yavapaiensis KR-236 TaxID=694435 RepID=A0A318SEA8_9DEIO|nr:ABC transporter permease [Deinococcus yavapaiensis]PYE55431.1 ABC-2 type transport system permease protein [Deinococcus yavapaiensis KR-236]
MNTSSSLDRVLAVARKEFLHVRRDAVLPRLIVLLPIVMLLLFGYALNTNVKNIKLGVVDASRDRVSERILASYAADDRFELISMPSRRAALDAARAGRVRAVLEISEGALAAARKQEAVPITLAVDGSDPAFSAQIRAASASAMQDVMAALGAVRAATGTLSLPARLTSEILYNPDNRSAVYMVPGLSGLILTLICVMLTALAIVREREAGTMEALIVTTVRPAEVVLGKLLPYFAFGATDAALVLGIGHWLFGVPLVGSVWLLVLAALLFVLGSLGLGILISTVARTQPQAMFATIAFIIPSIFLSGFLLPLEGFNRFFTALSTLVPLKYYLSAVRGIMLRGAELSDLMSAFVGLAVFAAITLLLASLTFKKTL